MIKEDLSPQKSCISNDSYLRKVHPILNKHRISIEDFIKMAEIDELTDQELQDLDYVEDRIMAHL